MTTPGTIPFHAVLKATPPVGEMVSAVLQGTGAAGALSSNCVAVAESGPLAANGLPLVVEALAAAAGADAPGRQQARVPDLPRQHRVLAAASGSLGNWTGLSLRQGGSWHRGHSLSVGRGHVTAEPPGVQERHGARSP